MNRTRRLTFAALLGLVAFLIPLAAVAAPPTAKTVLFGNERTGSEEHCGPDRNPASGAYDCPPIRFTGESAQAVDILIPRTTVISAGGTVTFDVSGPPHRVGVCEEGMEPEDVSLTALANVIQDARCNNPANASSGADVNYTFTEPGKYLIICKFLPHFVDSDQYGWVIVQ